MKKYLINLFLCFILIFTLTGCNEALDLFDNLLDTPHYGLDITNDEIQSQQIITTPEGTLKITFLDVGQGDATLIQTANSTILIDTGDWRGHSHEMFQYHITNKNITDVDLLILTHPHADHIGGAEWLIDNVNVIEVKYSSGSYDLIDTQTWERVLIAIDYNDVIVTHAEPGQIREFCDIIIEILGPLPELKTNANNASIFTRITHGNNQFQFSGDAYENAEIAMINAGLLREVDLVLLGHHGSSTSSSNQYLEILNPTWAIISVGYDNNFGHPHQSVLSTLDDLDVMVYRTDKNGTIQAISDGQYISFKIFQ